MTVKIGSKYLELLTTLKQYLTSIKKGGFQENPEVIIQEVNERKGRCNYDKCPAKNILCDRYILISHKSGRKELYPFHGACIEDLIKDRRLPSLN